MSVRILVGDVREQLRTLDAKSVQATICSPPYFQLRAYLEPDHPDKPLEIGQEATPAQFVETLVDVFREVKRVLRDDGVLFVNLGDSYAGSGKGPTGGNGIGDQEQRQGFVNAPLHCGNPEKIGAISGNQGATSMRGYPGMRAKSLMLIPERFAIAMADDGWIVRSQIVWAKKSAMPESVRDRCTSAWEPIFMFTKQGRYYFDQDAIRTPYPEASIKRNEYQVQDQRTGVVGHLLDGMQNSVAGKAAITRDAPALNPMGAAPRNVWHLGPEPLRGEEHYAAFPTEIPRRCILAASRKGDTILDPFGGSGTTGLVADQLERHAVLIDLSPTYAAMAKRRIEGDSPMFANVEVSS